MKKLKNPYTDRKGYRCFGCSPLNESGLKMEFYEDGDEIVSIWKPVPHFQGWHDILHGGVQSALMDEIACWVVFVKVGVTGVTSKMEFSLKRTVFTNKGDITLRASLKEMKRNIAIVSVKLFDANDKLCAEGELNYFTFPLEKSKNDFAYPGVEAFY